MLKIKVVTLFVVFSWLFPSAATFASSNKKMAERVAVSATFDFGNNTKELLEKGGSNVSRIIEQLTKSFDATIQKIFPYFVKQAYLNGIVSIMVWLGLTLLFLALAIVLYKLSRNRFNSEKEVLSALAITMLVIFAIVLVIGAFFFLSDWIIQATNPEYTAIRDLISRIKY